MPLVLLVAASVATADEPTASFVAPGSANVGTPVTFQASASAPTDTITNYLWDFGDGVTAGGSTVHHSYARPGTYLVTLTVVDSSGDTGKVERDIAIGGAPPNAGFTPDSGTVLAGSAIQFDGRVSSDPNPGASITVWTWKFGDGATASGPRPTHAYMMPGAYTVSLNVTDSAGKSDTITHQLSVIAPPPIQTLIRTIVAAPAALKSGRPSVGRSGVAQLGLRLFCPGPGPACTTTVTPRPHSAAYTSTASVAANHSFELVLLLTPRGLRALRAHGRLPVNVTITAVRGAETTRANAPLLLKRPLRKRG